MLEHKVLDNPSGSSFQVCISLDVLTIEKRTSLITPNMMSNSSNLENMLGVSSGEPEDVDFPIIYAFEKDNESSCSINCFGEFYIEREELNSISYIDDDGKNRLNIDWTSIIAKKIPK